MAMPLFIALATCLGLASLSLVLLRQIRENRRHKGLITSLQDQLAREQREALYQRISTERADTGLVILKLDGTVVWANDGYLRMMRQPADNVLGNSPLRYAFAPENRMSDAEIAAFRYDPDDYDHETRAIRENVRGDGEPISVQVITSFHDPYGDNPLAIVVVHDVTADIEREAQLRATSEKLAHIAAHDPLTGAANRSELGRFLKEALQGANDSGTFVGVLHIDLDKFKHINDTYGHSAGDAVLIAVTERASSKVRETDLIARVGGDEFVVVCPGLHGLAELQSIGNELAVAVSQPVSWENTNLPCQISVGAALSDDSTDDIDGLLARSDFALYEVKRTGRGNVATYNHDLHVRRARETQRERDLAEAVQTKSLDFHVQPIVYAQSGEVSGFETLVRWKGQDGHLIPPIEFLPLAESMGLMSDIDFLAMNAAMDFKQRLISRGYNGMQVGFNASPDVLSNPAFLPSLLSGLEFRGLTPQDIVLEVLETVVFESHGDSTPFVDRITDLHEAGVSMLLDDFGKGHAGIAHLSQLPVSGVKIDRGITTRAMEDDTTQMVLRTLLDLCHNLKLRIVTEGIETPKQALQLTTMGSTKLQGYFIARPMSQDEALVWLSERDSSAIAPWDSPRYLKAN